MVTIRDFPILVAQEEAAQAAFSERCPDCTTDVLSATIDDLGAGEVPQQVASYLQSNPDVDYVWFLFSNVSIGVSDALDGAGLLEGRSLVGTQAEVPQLQEIVDGTNRAWSALPFEYAMWILVDQMARHATGVWSLEQEAEASIIPTWVVDSPEAAEPSSSRPRAGTAPTASRTPSRRCGASPADVGLACCRAPAGAGDPRALQDVPRSAGPRRRGPRPSTAARSTPCSARTAPASRPSSRSSPATTRPTPVPRSPSTASRCASACPAPATSLGLRFVHQDLGLVPTAQRDRQPRPRARLSHQPDRADQMAGRGRRRPSRDGRPRPPRRPARHRSHRCRWPSGPSWPSPAPSTTTSGATSVLVLDEPTAALPADEVERLFAVLRRLRDRGRRHPARHPSPRRGAGDRRPRHRPARRPAGGHRGIAEALDHDQLVELILGRAISLAPPPPAAATQRQPRLHRARPRRRQRRRPHRRRRRRRGRRRRRARRLGPRVDHPAAVRPAPARRWRGRRRDDGGPLARPGAGDARRHRLRAERARPARAVRGDGGTREPHASAACATCAASAASTAAPSAPRRRAGSSGSASSPPAPRRRSPPCRAATSRR